VQQLGNELEARLELVEKTLKRFGVGHWKATLVVRGEQVGEWVVMTKDDLRVVARRLGGAVEQAGTPSLVGGPDSLQVLRRVFEAMDLEYRYDELWDMLGCHVFDQWLEDDDYEAGRAKAEQLLRDVQALLPDVKIPLPPPPDSELDAGEDGEDGAP
jgi:hypothetical protein